MSYEEMIPDEEKCPCGIGFIIKKWEIGDWSRIKYHKPLIECGICSKNYEPVYRESQHPKGKGEGWVLEKKVRIELFKLLYFF